MVVAQLDAEVVGFGALVVQDGDDFGHFVVAFGEADGVLSDVEGLAFGREVAGVVALDVAAEEVQLGDQLVEDRVLVVFIFP